MSEQNPNSRTFFHWALDKGEPATASFTGNDVASKMWPTNQVLCAYAQSMEIKKPYLPHQIRIVL